MYLISRKITRQINVGKVLIGGSAPVSVQTMTTVKVSDVNSTLNQINRATIAGCDLVRVAVNTDDDIIPLSRVIESSPIPVIADIQFIPGLAVKAIRAGVNGIRINPGYLRETRELENIIKTAREHNSAIRIGSNSGSIQREIYCKKMSVAEIMVQSVSRISNFFLERGFTQFKVSLKASSVIETIDAYHIASEKFDCPLHLGITEAGPIQPGLIKSSVCIGSLLLDGIGDTIRISLTADPVQEVIAGRTLMRSIGMLDEGIDVISCPTCGRCEVDLIGLAQQFYEKTLNVKKLLKVAIMGCPVNGPGEARDADLGAAFSKDYALIFKQGVKLKKVRFNEAFDALLNEIDEYIEGKDE